MPKVNFILRTLFSFFLLASTATINAQEGQSQQVVLSKTRTIYLEKIKGIESNISAFETKIEWVQNNPVEDSIAKSEGWYEKMFANLEKFKNQLVFAQVEQIQNYYNEILELPFDPDHIQNKIIVELVSKRFELARNYPDLDEFIPLSEESIKLITAWVKDFPLEYSVFMAYLENLVISNSK